MWQRWDDDDQEKNPFVSVILPATGVLSSADTYEIKALIAKDVSSFDILIVFFLSKEYKKPFFFFLRKLQQLVSLLLVGTCGHLIYYKQKKKMVGWCYS